VERFEGSRIQVSRGTYIGTRVQGKECVQTNRGVEKLKESGAYVLNATGGRTKHICKAERRTGGEGTKSVGAVSQGSENGGEIKPVESRKKDKGKTGHRGGRQKFISPAVKSGRKNRTTHLVRGLQSALRRGSKQGSSAQMESKKKGSNSVWVGWRCEKWL